MARRRTFLFIGLCLTLSATAPFRHAFSAQPDWPREIEHAKGKLTLLAKPQRIISTAPSLTGILLAIGAPVVASAATTPSGMTDPTGFFSQWSDVAHQRGVEVLYGNLVFDIEAVIGWNPDLIIGSSTGADSVAQHYAELNHQHLPVMIVDYANHGWQDVARQLGRATGREEQAEAAIKEFDQYAADAATKLALAASKVTVVGYNIGGSYSIGKPESAQAQVLSSLGMTVAGLPDTLRGGVTRSSDFDFISHENLPAAITGDTVFLLRANPKDVDAFLADPILANLPAVINRRVYPLGQSSFRIDYYSGRQMIDTVVDSMRKP
ncbi:Fe2+-enterobactin ABC transporter substrate-binding protein [Agrobacterium sp. NPDC090273]|uniref:Fe2+-enterobactin ABC transporter substrate-binding protein n=1 Tax=Agrobacterium sp. NPDC090273 TaxID=3363919 RepID=UPI00383AD7F4